MVSVIIPVFNGEKYIGQAIESVLNQTYKDIEIIVVDDGSSDGTANVVKRYRSVKYIFQENRGPSNARNTGINEANGEYIAFLDADDLYMPEKISEQVKALDSDKDSDIVYNDTQIADDELKRLKVLKSEGIYQNREDFLCMLLFRQIISTPHSMMIRRKCIDEGMRYNEALRCAEDYELIIRLARKYRFKYIEKALYVYRKHSSNLTNNIRKQHESELKVLESIGFNEIERIVEASRFDEKEKRLILSKIYIKMGNFLRAEGILEDYIKTCVDCYAYFYLGNCCFYLGDYIKARENLLRAIELDGNMAEAFNNLGCLYIREDKERAQELFKKAMIAMNGYMDAEYNLCQALSGKGDFKFTKLELRKQLMVYK